MTEDKILVQPVEGKYLSASVDGKNYEIHLVDPSTEHVGTLIPRKVALRLLAKKHPLISVVPKIENGVFVSQLTSEEMAIIEDLREHPENVKNIQNDETTEVKAKNATLETLVATQASQIEILTKQLASFEAKMEAMSKTSKKSAKKDEE